MYELGFITATLTKFHSDVRMWHFSHLSEPNVVHVCVTTPGDRLCLHSIQEGGKGEGEGEEEGEGRRREENLGEGEEMGTGSV